MEKEKIIRRIKLDGLRTYPVVEERMGTCIKPNPFFTERIKLHVCRGYRSFFKQNKFVYFLIKDDIPKDFSTCPHEDINDYLLHFSDADIAEFRKAGIL